MSPWAPEKCTTRSNTIKAPKPETRSSNSTLVHDHVVLSYSSHLMSIIRRSFEDHNVIWCTFTVDDPLKPNLLTSTQRLLAFCVGQYTHTEGSSETAIANGLRTIVIPVFQGSMLRNARVRALEHHLCDGEWACDRRRARFERCEGILMQASAVGRYRCSQPGSRRATKASVLLEQLPAFSRSKACWAKVVTRSAHARSG